VSDEQLDYLIKRHTTNEKRCNEVMVHVLKLRKEIKNLKQQLDERDELILELASKVSFYANWINTQYGLVVEDDIEIMQVYQPLEKDKNGVRVGGKLARTPLKNQKLLDGIKGRV
jgi:sensor histidine kinase regulating citrate/malate metabolism